MLYVVLILVFVFSVQPPADLDLGWHLRYGEYFFKTGHVLKDNILSVVWPDYKWVQASWGYDLISFQLFNHFSFFGLSLFAGLVTVLTFLVITHPIKRFSTSSLIILSTLFLALCNLMYITSLRSQTLSTLFFALTLVISVSFLRKQESIKIPPKFIYILPILFWIWANLHGGFPLGLIVISLIWISSGLLRLIKPKLWLIFGAILLLSYLTPLINPYGFRIYEETFKHSSNINLALVKEWQPFTKWPFEAATVSLIMLLVLIFGFLRKKVSDIPFLLALIPFTYLAFNALRFITVLGVMLTFYLAQILSSIGTLRMTFFKRALAAIFVVLFVLDLLFFQRFVRLPTLKIINFSWPDYCQSLQSCSEELTSIMLKDPPKGVGFNPYGYGGYLIWRVPQVKTFVDGRMAAWEENGKTPPILESATLNSPYAPVVFRKLDGQYHFSWVIINTDSPITKYLDQLVKNGTWEKLYQDNLYSYYVKKAV